MDIQVAEDILNPFEDFKEDETTEQQVNRFRHVVRTPVSPFSLIMHTAQEILNHIEQEPETFNIGLSQVRTICVIEMIRFRLRMSWFVDENQMEQPLTQQELQENAWQYCQESGPLPQWKSRAYLPRFCFDGAGGAATMGKIRDGRMYLCYICEAKTL